MSILPDSLVRYAVSLYLASHSHRQIHHGPVTEQEFRDSLHELDKRLHATECNRCGESGDQLNEAMCDLLGKLKTKVC